MPIFALLLQVAVWSAGAAIPDYDCDAPRGSYDKHELSGAETGFRVSGVITPEGIGRGPNQWLPAAGVLFQPDDGHGGVGVQFWQSSPTTLSYGVRRLGADSDRPSPLGTVPIDQPIRFVLALDGEGRLEFEVNGKVYVLPDAALRAKNPILMCSGGHFRFESLTTSTE